MSKNFHCRSVPLRAMLGVAGIAAIMTSAFAQLSASGSEVAAGDTLSITLNQPTGRTDSVYLALLFGGGIYFLDENGALSPYRVGAPTPRRLANVAAGRHALLSLTIPAGLAGIADFYSAFGQSGVDVLATPGALDMSSLQHVGVTLTAAAANGKSLYAQHCAACHGASPLGNLDGIRNGSDLTRTKLAIDHDKGGMGYLSFLSDTEHAAIAAWIANPI